MDIALVKDYLSNCLDAKVPALVKRDLKLRAIKGKATIIIGPRRAGKTSLMWQTISGYDRHETAYLDFEDIALKGITATDALRVVTELFTEVCGKKAKDVFLDEIQNLDDWQSFVRTLLDRGYVVYATGSSSKLLTREIATQLRGRSIAFLLLPFSFKEYVIAIDAWTDTYRLTDVGMIKNRLSQYLDSGGYPEIVLGKENKEKLLGEYRELIFFKDFVERHGIKSIEVARFIFNFVTQCFASEMSVRKVLNALKSNGVAFGRNTVYDYVEKLQDTMIFFFLSRYSTKVNVRSGWPKKVYLADNGLAWRLPYDKGRLLENAVFLELKRRQALAPLDEIYYYRDSNNHEVDFIIRDVAVIKELLQVTYASNRNEIKREETESLQKIGKELKCKNLTVITWDYDAVQRNP